MSWRRFCKTSSRLFKDILARRLEDVLKMSWKCLEDVWPRRVYWSWSRRLEDVFRRRMSIANMFVLIKTSWRRFLKTKTKDVFKKSSSRQMLPGAILMRKFVNSLLGRTVLFNMWIPSYQKQYRESTTNDRCNSKFLATSIPVHLVAIREGEKESLEHLKHVIKICPNKGHIFQNELRNTWTAMLKSADLQLPI